MIIITKKQLIEKRNDHMKKMGITPSGPKLFNKNEFLKEFEIFKNKYLEDRCTANS